MKWIVVIADTATTRSIVEGSGSSERVAAMRAVEKLQKTRALTGRTVTFYTYTQDGFGCRTLKKAEVAQ